MKIVTAENGQKRVKISKSEWEVIGRKQGWTKESQTQQGNQFSNLIDVDPNQRIDMGTTYNPEALKNTLASMGQNLQGAYNQLSNLYESLEQWQNSGTPMSDPNSIQTMIDQIISTLESTKNFVPNLVEYSKVQQIS